mgnify:CR=1 FL=1
MKKIHIIGPQGQKNINDLVIYLILPCNILHAFTQSAADGNFIKYLEILLISIGIQVFCVIYGKVMFRKEPEGRYKCLQYGTICSNAGFLGNPIAEGIYGAEGLVLASVYLIPQRIMMWSSGLAVFSGSSDKMKTLKKVVTHPCILACVLGIILMVTGLPHGGRKANFPLIGSTALNPSTWRCTPIPLFSFPFRLSMHMPLFPCRHPGRHQVSFSLLGAKVKTGLGTQIFCRKISTPFQG